MKNIFYSFVAAMLLLMPQSLSASKLLGVKVVDQDYLMLHFRDGEVHYRDSGTGETAYLGHSFVEGDDSLFVFGKRVDANEVQKAALWSISSADDKTFGTKNPLSVYRKAKLMNIDNTLKGELDHWVFLKLPQSMKQGCTYTVSIPDCTGADKNSAEIKFDVWNCQTEAIHVNIIGYSPSEISNPADLYMWLGDGGQRDYKAWEGKKVYLYEVNTHKKISAGTVKFWKERAASENEAGRKDLTASDVWSADFKTAKPGTYRLVIDGIGCSMDFEINNDIYYQPYRYSVRGYYYMRLGEPIDPEHVWPVPRQPQFIPEVDPKGLTIYKTDLQPWSEDWRKIHSDVWDDPHFKPAMQSIFWQHRLPGNPVALDVKGGHSDAFDWDRHLAHVSNIYDMLLPYILTGGRLSEDNLGIRESGNGIPDIMDEARNEVDFFLSIRDGEAYSQGVTNPCNDWSIMFQAGCTTMAAWANAANCAMMAEAFRIAGNDSLKQYYTDEAVKAYRFADRQENKQLDDMQDVGNMRMRGWEFRQLAAAYIYNLTGDTQWEDIAVADFRNGNVGPCQVWAAAAYLSTPQVRHHADVYNSIIASVNANADNNFISNVDKRPSRRATNNHRWITDEPLEMVVLAHYIAKDKARRQKTEDVLYLEACWGLGRNPSNRVEMTGLGQRNIENTYTTGRNDGAPGTHPGQTPFLGTETWSKGNGGDARLILDHCYPSWDENWPRQESYFNQRYFWVNGEFTPRETMRGKMALLAYLYGIRK